MTPGGSGVNRRRLLTAWERDLRRIMTDMEIQYGEQRPRDDLEALVHIAWKTAHRELEDLKKALHAT